MPSHLQQPNWNLGKCFTIQERLNTKHNNLSGQEKLGINSEKKEIANTIKKKKKQRNPNFEVQFN